MSFQPIAAGKRPKTVDLIKRMSMALAETRVGNALLLPIFEENPRRALFWSNLLKYRFIAKQILIANPGILQSYFEQVKRFCLFLSTARSGHSIMSHLLSAHPKVLISDELAAVTRFQEGLSREQVFSLIKFQDYAYSLRNRKKSGYNYKVDSVWQDEFEKFPEVVGDAKGARTTNLLGGDEGYLEFLRSKLSMPIRVIVHLRNPFDAITTKVRRRKIELGDAVSAFVRKEQLMANAYARLENEEKLIQRHEDVVADPERHFIRMFEFLEVEPMPEVVKACARKIWKKPNVTRSQIEWQGQEIERLKDCLRQSVLFHSYLED